MSSTLTEKEQILADINKSFEILLKNGWSISEFTVYDDLWDEEIYEKPDDKPNDSESYFSHGN